MCDLNELKIWNAVFLVLYFCVRARGEVAVDSLDVPELAPPGLVSISCGWRLHRERLQSIKLLADGQELFQYRAGEYLNRTLLGVEVLNSSCSGPSLHVQGEDARGKCSLGVWLDPLNPRPRTFTCEVSGERPMFQVDNATKTLHIYVSVQETRLRREAGAGAAEPLTLNCSTSAAVPPPLIAWTLDDVPMKGEREVTTWNAQAGGWETWSLLRVRGTGAALRAVCTPKQNLGERVITSTPAELLLQPSAATVARTTVLSCTALPLLTLLGISYR